VKGRDLAQSKRLELGLVRVRWLVVAFGIVQTALVLQSDRSPAFAAPLSLLVTFGLAAGNVLLTSEVRRAEDPARIRAVGFAAFVLDSVAILGLVWSAGASPASPVWVIGYLLPLEGALRYGMAGAIVGAGVFGLSEVAREVSLAARLPRHAFDLPALAVRLGMGFILAIAAGGFARSLQRETARARERAELAWKAARLAEEAALREQQARREVNALHSAVLAGTADDDLLRGLQAVAETIATELGSEALSVVLVDDAPDGSLSLLAAGVSGDPGYRAGDRLPITSDPIGDPVARGRPSLRPDPCDAVVPMVVEGDTVGAIHEHSSRPGGIDRERLLLLGRLADQIGLVIRSARLRAKQEETVQRLRELDEMKSDFVAITSHELRTPLSAIRGFVDVLRRRGDDLPPEQEQEFLGIIAVQTERLIRLVEDLLVVSRIEAGKLAFEPKEIPVSTVVDHTVAGLGDQAGRIHAAIAPDAPAILTVDPQRLQQVLTNLLSNALKFSPTEAGVDLVVTSPVEGTVAFAVTDRGPGIAPEDQERIFERFHQAEHATTRAAEGFGLGLYITRQLVGAMGGWIHVDSELGVGSTFTVTLPADRGLVEPASVAPISGVGRA
jgi:signal transduction histidine kinase